MSKQSTSEKEKEEKINFLVKEINHHRSLYYNQTPEISDAKYDILEDELRELDPSNPVFFTVGYDASDLFTKKEHIIPMGSQDKVTTPEAFREWVRKRDLNFFLIQFKLDGISIELQYENGYFKAGLTRGDGKIGDDVTANVIKMKGFIPKLKSSFVGAIRGEVLMFHDIYTAKYSDKQNCRNAAAGIVRRKDGDGCEDLDIVFYDAISLSEDVRFKNETDKMKWMENEDFPVVESTSTKDPNDIVQFRQKVMDSIRDSLEFDIDGLVIKSNEIDLEDMKRARPKKQIAFKFQAEEIETVVLDVEWSKSGHHYTPIAIVESVRLMGSKLGRASLANPNLIDDLGLKIGSEVIISKRGDIIPKIEKVIINPPDAKDIEIPNVCEVCNTKLVNEGTTVYCPNEGCPKRDYHRLRTWIKKLEVKHFSEKLMLGPLFETKKVQKIADLYSLKVSDLTKFDGVKEASAKKALDNLLAIKEVSLARFIAGFNIENIAEVMVQKVVDAGFTTLEDIKSSNPTKLSQIEGFGVITANLLHDGIKKRYSEMQDVLNTGKIKIKQKIKGSRLQGLTFCFTGKLETIKRGEAEQLVAENGGQAKSNVVRNLSYLVTNDTAPTAKYKKAKAQGTKIITEKEFLDLIK
jgi:DNA ligase (NAD+)